MCSSIAAGGAVHLMMYFVLVHMVCAGLSTIIPQIQAGEGVPPKLDGSVSRWKSVREGEKQVRLECPVEDDGHVMVEWKKADQIIGPAWIRYRQRDTILKIKNVQLYDAGHYTCEAVNGFGRKVAHITLVVYGRDEAEPDERRHIVTLSPDIKNSAPIWEKPGEINTLSSSSLVKQLASILMLECRALGKPMPEVFWYYNGARLTEWQMHDFDDRLVVRGFKLVLNDLKITDSGRFTCSAENAIGEKRADFDVQVVNNVPGELPQFDTSIPVNKTVRVGLTATLLCRVSSPVLPLIKWLKRITDHSQIRDNSSIFQANDMDLVVVDIETHTIAGADNSYTSELVIPHVGVNHAGAYICVVTDVAGHIVHRSAYLTVLPYSAEPLGVGIPLHFLIGVPVALVLLIAAGYIIYLLRARKTKPSVRTCVLRPPPPNHPLPSLPPSIVRKSPEGASRSAAFYSTSSPEQRYLLTAARNELWNNKNAPMYRDTYYQLDPSACRQVTGEGSEDWYESTPQPYEINYDHSELEYDVGARTHLQPHPSLYSCNR